MGLILVLRFVEQVLKDPGQAQVCWKASVMSWEVSYQHKKSAGKSLCSTDSLCGHSLDRTEPCHRAPLIPKLLRDFGVLVQRLSLSLALSLSLSLSIERERESEREREREYVCM